MNLIIVSGMPCTGKTSISSKISLLLGKERLSKDYYKEKLFEQFGFSSEDEKRNLDILAEKYLYQEIENKIELNHDIVLDKWLQGLDPLKTLKKINKVNIIFIRLYCNPQIAVIRYNKRNKNGERPLSFLTKNQYPIKSKENVIYEEEMSYNTMLEKSKRPFFRNGIENLLEIDTSLLEDNIDYILDIILAFIKKKMR